MASSARCRDALKRGLLPESEFVREYLSQEDVAAAATAADYHWRERTWTPFLTLWTFLAQALHAGWACRQAVAHVLAQHATAGTPLEASPDPSGV